MRAPLCSLLAAAAVLVPQSASACAPPPPGYVPPTDEQRLSGFVAKASDIVYGVVTRSAGPNDPVALKVLHVYKGALAKGDVIEAPANWDYPVPYCAGMMTPPPAKPVGAWGVFAYNAGYPSLVRFPPAEVDRLIERGLIKSARKR